MRRNTVNRGLVSPRNRKERKIKSGVERKGRNPDPSHKPGRVGHPKPNIGERLRHPPCVAVWLRTWYISGGGWHTLYPAHFPAERFIPY